MSAPLIWVAIPLGLAAIFLLFRSERWLAWLGGISAAVLCGLAYWLPVDTAVQMGAVSFRIDSTFTILGRQFSLPASDQTLIVLIYGAAAFWFLGSLAGGGWQRSIVPLGMAIVALLVASLAVRPFLYAALFIQLAVLLSIPLLLQPGRRPGRGTLRFITFQSLATPFILLAGFLLSGVDAGPSDLALIGQAAFVLAMGFAFLLAIFPFYAWVPLVAEESPPYAVGFILTIFPVFSILFALNFMDRYSWLRDSDVLYQALQSAGLIMLVTASIWVAFQRHLGRVMGYATVMETGMALLALSLPDRAVGLLLVFYMIIPRTLAFGVWAMSLSILARNADDLRFSTIQGMARSYPLAAAGVIVAGLAVSGMPLLAFFPIRQALWAQLASQSLVTAAWFGLGILGFWVVSMRSLAVLVMQREDQAPGWEAREDFWQRALLGLGLLGIFLAGIFPQSVQPLLANISIMFDHLGR